MTTENAVRSRTGESTAEGRSTAMSTRVVLALAGVTGASHVYLYATESWLPFLAAGLGFLGWMGLYAGLPRYRRALAVGGVLFTLAQVGGYLLFPMGPLWLGVLDKAVQVALVGALAWVFVAEGTDAEADTDADPRVERRVDAADAAPEER